jgi:branched-chain amino acid transport system ATP-binding protein
MRKSFAFTWDGAPALLEISSIVGGYGKISALRGVSLHIEKGELVTLIGANGAGKTTTLRAISGLVKPTSGRILLAGEDITGAAPRHILAKGIAHCPEGRRVFSYMTVQENLEMGCHLRGDRAEVTADMSEMFKEFPRLEERRKQLAGTLSGGEQQMLAIARALMSRPKLILFDEPSLGLAPKIVEQVFEIITQICKKGITVLLVEQNAFAALEMCDRAYLLESGTVRLSGTGEQLLNEPHVKTAYLGG